MLATEGLLELLPSRGARVAALSAEEINDVLLVIGGLEALAAELTCARITDREINAIAAHYQAIMAAASNPMLAGFYANPSGCVARARYAAHKTRGIGPRLLTNTSACWTC